MNSINFQVFEIVDSTTQTVKTFSETEKWEAYNFLRLSLKVVQ